MTRNFVSWDSLMRVKYVRRVVEFLSSESGRLWLARLVLPVLAILMFVALTHLYNIWTGLTSYNFFRRTAATFALGAILFGPAVIWRARIQAAYLGAVSLFFGVLLIANAVYAGYAGGFLSASTLSYFWQAGDTTGSIRELLELRMMTFLLPGTALIALALIMPQLRIWVPSSKKWLAWKQLQRRSVLLVAAGIFLTTSLGYGYVAFKEWQHYGDLIRITSNPYDARELVRKIGITNYNVVDGVNYLRRKRSLTAEEVAFVASNRSSQVAASGPNEATGWLAGRNVIFLQLESFQQFLIGRQVNGQEITPNLNRIAAGSRQYTNFHYSIGPGTSSDGEFATFNSLLPLANQAVAFDYPVNSYRAYPGELKKQGYSTSAYHGDSRNFWNRADTFPVFGFDEYIAEEDFKPGKAIGFGLSDYDFLAETADMITGLKQPFYAHAISLSSHTPYGIPLEDQSLDLTGVNIKPLQYHYLQSVHYADKAIGEFLSRLEKAGLMDKTALLVMGDHEGFLFSPEDDDYAKFLGIEGGFNDVSNLNARTIPFMIYAPGSPVGGVDDRPASQIDVYPTLVNLLGLKKPETILGVDLFSDQNPTVVRRSRGIGASIESVRRGDMLYSANSLEGNEAACYRGSEKVAVEGCYELRDFAVKRALLSDYVIMGNRLDLLQAP